MLTLHSKLSSKGDFSFIQYLFTKNYFINWQLLEFSIDGNRSSRWSYLFHFLVKLRKGEKEIYFTKKITVLSAMQIEEN